MVLHVLLVVNVMDFKAYHAFQEHVNVYQQVIMTHQVNHAVSIFFLLKLLI